MPVGFFVSGMMDRFCYDQAQHTNTIFWVELANSTIEELTL